MYDQPPYKVFVTGGTGLVGAHLLFDLAQKGIAIRALRRQRSDIEIVRKVFQYYSEQADTLFDRIEWVYGDLREPHTFMEALQGVRYVFHSAAMVSFNPKDQDAIRQANVLGTSNIVEQCLRYSVEKLCYVSSVATLGKPDDGVPGEIDENTPINPSTDLSDYARSKYEAEQEVWKGIERGLNAVIINPSVIIGPGDWDRSSANIIKRIWKGFPLYSTGGNSFVDVRDVARVMIALAESPVQGERFVVTSENWSFQKLLFTIADHLGKRRPYIKATPWMGEIAWRTGALWSFLTGNPPSVTRATTVSAYQHYSFRNSKIKNYLHFDFIPVEQSIRHACRLFLEEVSGEAV